MPGVMRTSVTDDELIAVLRTCPRSTTHDVMMALLEDENANMSEQAVRKQLTRLYEADRVGREDHRNHHPRYFTWWVL